MNSSTYLGVIFDLDGVISNTATLHSRAWKSVFDLTIGEYCKTLSREKIIDVFDEATDYGLYVDGKSRYEGIRSFLTARNIELPYGDIHDVCATSVHGIANLKNSVYQAQLSVADKLYYDDTIALISKLKANRVPIAVASSSKNCSFILGKLGLNNVFDYVLGGDHEYLSLRSKPYPDVFTEVIKQLGVDKASCIVIEDAPSGVTAASNAAVGLVIGLDRSGTRNLSNYGAHYTVQSLDQLNLTIVDGAVEWNQG